MALSRRTSEMPRRVLVLGFASSVLGVVTTYVFPATRAPALTLWTLLQSLAVFGGMVAMLCGAYAMDSEGPREADAKLRDAVRYHVVLVTLGALAYGLNAPLGLVLPLLLAGKLNAWLTPVWRWLGRF